MLQKGSEALKSPTSYRNDTHERLTCAQAPNGGADCISSTKSSSSVDERLSTRRLYHQATPVTDGAAHEHKKSVSFDEQCSSRSEMWDPVKDCSTTPADVAGFLPARQNSSRLASSKAGVSTSTGLHLSHSDQLYSQARESERRSTNLGSREFALPLDHQPHSIGLGYRGNASMDLLPSPQSQGMASPYQVNASVHAQPIHVDRPHDFFQHYRQHRPVYEDVSTLHPHLRDRSGQIGSMHSRSSPSSTIANLPTQQISGYQRADHHQRQSFFPDMSEAIEMAQYAERLEQESNRGEAMHVYERARALFQEVIIRSGSFEERLECNAAVSQ